MALVGPGANITDSNIAPTPMLWSASDNDVIQVYNPLSDDFGGRIGHSNNTDAPFMIRQTEGAPSAVRTEADVQLTYGITSLRNADHPAPAQITTQVILKAGETTSLQGGVAKVVVNQLVNEIMQRNGDSLKLADPTARHAVELTVVQGSRNIQELMGSNFLSERQQMAEAVDNLNREPAHEEAFAGERGTATPQENNSLKEPGGNIGKLGKSGAKQTG